jgi:hypothetical protein
MIIIKQLTSDTNSVMFPEDNLCINITHFDFVSQMTSLLKDKSLTGDLAQLDVPQDNPFARYKSPNGRLCAFNAGWGYVCGPNSNDWMCPIIYRCDETIVGSSQGRALRYLFLTSVFKTNVGWLYVRPCKTWQRHAFRR